MKWPKKKKEQDPPNFGTLHVTVQKYPRGETQKRTRPSHGSAVEIHQGGERTTPFPEVPSWSLPVLRPVLRPYLGRGRPGRRQGPAWACAETYSQAESSPPASRLREACGGGREAATCRWPLGFWLLFVFAFLFFPLQESLPELSEPSLALTPGSLIPFQCKLNTHVLGPSLRVDIHPMKPTAPSC